MRRTKMPTERDTYTDDLNIKLADAIRLLAERVTPKPLDPKAQEAIQKHAALTRALRFGFETVNTPTGK
jgi:hypothetical protein